MKLQSKKYQAAYYQKKGVTLETYNSEKGKTQYLGYQLLKISFG